MTIRKQSVTGVMVAVGLLGCSAAFAEPGGSRGQAGSGQAAIAASNAGSGQAAIAASNAGSGQAPVAPPNAGTGQTPGAAPNTGTAPASRASADTQSGDVPPVIPYVAAATRTGAADIQLRSTSPALDAALLNKTAETAEPIASSATIYIERARNSAATQYVYAITRDGQVAVSSDKPVSIPQNRILLRHRTEEVAGLRSGAVTLWVWGVDQFGHISGPAKAKFIIAGQD